MKKLLIICGPTATGKTSLALYLSKHFAGELVSVDSRQVYKGMDIGTGKDLPPGAKFQESNLKYQNKKIGFYEIDSIKVWGLDLVSPKEEFSVSHFIETAGKILTDIWDRKKLPILVGGTGFYIKGLTEGIQTIEIPININLREELENWTVKKLFDQLIEIDYDKANSMNSSDKMNPRRLIRAIEVADWAKNNQRRSIIISSESEKSDKLFIGLTAPQEYISQKIEKRVNERILSGSEKEVRGLLKAGVTWSMKSMDTLGYKEWKGYFEHNSSLEEVSKKWILDEIHYAKRQMTWFKKDKRIDWFDITEKNWQKKVEILVEKWQNNSTKPNA